MISEIEIENKIGKKKNNKKKEETQEKLKWNTTLFLSFNLISFKRKTMTDSNLS